MKDTTCKISVIVPVYNVEKCLKQCIDSLLMQSFADFELLLIDDGSLDNSRNICKEYSNANNHVKLFCKENGGVSSARNVGLNNAKGEYICFIDSDDYVAERYLEDLYNGLESGQNSFIIQGCLVLLSSKEIFRYKLENKVEGNIFLAFSKYELFKHGGPTCKLFKASILKVNKIYFPEMIHNYEDLLFLMDYLRYVDCIKFMSIENYFYVRHDESLSTKLNSFSSELECYHQYKKKLKLLNNGNIQNNATEYAGELLMRAIRSLYLSDQNKNSRLDKIRAIPSADTEILKKYKPRKGPKYVFDIFFRFLLNNRIFIIFDCYYKVYINSYKRISKILNRNL